MRLGERVSGLLAWWLALAAVLLALVAVMTAVAPSMAFASEPLRQGTNVGTTSTFRAYDSLP